MLPVAALQPPHIARVACQVLSDVGDGQSLQQNLSTFSAHVRRLRLILGAVTPRSLALLDEVGSGANRLRPLITQPAVPAYVWNCCLHRLPQEAMTPGGDLRISECTTEMCVRLSDRSNSAL